jgi:hypothetical protein
LTAGLPYQNLYITITVPSPNPNAKSIVRAAQRRYAQAGKNAGADEVIIPQYEGGLMAGRLLSQYAGRGGKLEQRNAASRPHPMPAGDRWRRDRHRSRHRTFLGEERSSAGAGDLRKSH